MQEYCRWSDPSQPRRPQSAPRMSLKPTLESRPPQPLTSSIEEERTLVRTMKEGRRNAIRKYAER